MKYEKIWDRENRIYRVIGIGFERDASDEFIEEVIQEIFQMDTMQPNLKTEPALLCCIHCGEEYVLERMRIMPIGKSFKYGKYKITRHSEHTYNYEQRML